LLVEKLTARGLLKVVCGTDTLGVGVNVRNNIVMIDKLKFLVNPRAMTPSNEDTILLRRVSRPPHHGLIDLLQACLYPFEVPPKANDRPRSIEL